MSPHHPQQDQFLKTFFGPGNRIRWEQVQTHSESSNAKRVRPFIEALRPDWDCLILPRVWADNRVTWYAMAPSPRQVRVLQEELVAFVGPSFTGFSGQPALLDAHDPIEAAILAFSGGDVFRLDVVDPSLKDACRDRLAQLLEVRGLRPKGRGLTLRHPGRVLRDFELALLTAEPTVAGGYLDELQKLGRLSAENIRFLQVRYHETFEEWDSIEAMIEDGAILAVRRPARVTQALIRAIYRKELSRYEVDRQAVNALGAFRERVWPRFSGLYRIRSGMDAPEVLYSFMLAAAAGNPPSVHRRDALLETCPASSPARPYLESLARLIPDAATPVLADPLDEASRAFADGDVDRTLALLRDIPVSEKSLILVLRASAESDSLDSARVAQTALSSAPPDMRERILSVARWRSLWEAIFPRGSISVQSAHSPSLPSDGGGPGWLNWLEKVCSEPDWPEALATAEQGAEEWSVEEEARRPDRVAAVTKRIEEVSGPSEEMLYLALPHLMRFYLDRAGPQRVFKSVYGALFERCIYDPGANTESVRTAGVLLEALAAAGVDGEKCAAHIRDVISLWDGRPSPDLLDWGLDLLDRLIVSQAVLREALIEFAGAVRAQLIRWFTRRQPAQYALFTQLCAELFIEPGLPAERRDGDSADAGDVDALTRLVATRSIALYSLREETIERVHSVLAGLSPSADVRRYSDHVGSEPLRHAARHADIFLIVTGAAKHAATTFIEANRPPGAITLRCHQTGSATLLRLLSQEANKV